LDCVSSHKFLERVGTDGERVIHFANDHGHYASWTFYAALGELRGTFGIHVAKVRRRVQAGRGGDLLPKILT
jgi:hypothetical protein